MEAPFMDENEGPDEDIIPYEDTPIPLPRKTYVCTGVLLKNQRRMGDPHPCPLGSKPEGGTTDAAERYVVGRCSECGGTTIWKGATL
jgi:hypothetical protein